MNDYWHELLEQIFRHRGKVIGTLLGLLLGWMIIEYGVIKTVFVALCLVAGYAIGSRIDRGGSNWP